MPIEIIDIHIKFWTMSSYIKNVRNDWYPHKLGLATTVPGDSPGAHLTKT